MYFVPIGQVIKLNFPVLFSSLIFFSFLSVNGQNVPKPFCNGAFSFGEKITYKVRYSLYVNISVGEVNFEVMGSAEDIGGNQCYHIVGTGKTYRFYDAFFKINDKYESFVETADLLPLVSFRDVNEGGYKFNEAAVFNNKKNTVKTKKSLKKVPPSSMDVLTCIYYSRTFDYDKAVPDQIFYLNAFIDDSVYRVGVKYEGKVTIKTEAGKFRCLKLIPILITDRIFKSKEGMVLYVTDDANHIPVRVESGISVGAIRADLAHYEGLKNEMKSKL
jgi:hypothetical protein